MRLLLLLALAAAPVLAQPVLLADGATVTGELTATSDTRPDGRFVFTYVFEAEGPFEVHLTSRAFGTHLALTSPSGAERENDDFGGAEGESRLRVRPEPGEHGRWTLNATTDEPGEAGAYEVTLNALTDDEAAVAEADDRALARADSLQGLGVTLRGAGQSAEAEPLAREVLAIRKGVLGPGHLGVATSLNGLALLLLDQGDYAAARPLLERSLAVRETALGPDHPSVAAALNNLARLLWEQGDYAAARPLFERSIAIVEVALGPDHRDLGAVLNNLALLLQAQGDYIAARPFYERSLAIREAALGPDHRDVAKTLNSLAGLLQDQGDYAAGRPLYLRTARIYDGHATRVLPTLAVAEQRAFFARDLSRTMGDLLSAGLDGPTLAEDYDVFAGWKGLLTHGLRRQTAIARLAAYPAHAADVERLRGLRGDLAGWYGRAGRMPLATWQARNDSLTAEKEQLERDLARALPEGALDDPLDRLGPAGLAGALPAGAAFVDVYRYAHRLGPDSTEARYAAVVTVHSAPPVLVPLGAADALDSLADAWLDAVVEGSMAAPERDALVAVAWAPVAAALPAGTSRVWVAPDGELVRVPWAVLAEAHAPTAAILVAETGSARDLAGLLAAPDATDPAGASVLVVGGVDFGPDPTGAVVEFRPLPGTASEVVAVAALAREAGVEPRSLGGTAATPVAVAAAMAGATYAHLATHGIFYGETRTVYASRAGGDRPGGAPINLAGRNPLVESGLALAGANGGPAGQLTAEELVGLDLAGTRLVVLSACETGRGAEVTGQGVLGLRSALAAAGARSVLMSLWEVPDASTALLMGAFYRALWTDGAGPAAALRQAQAVVRSDPRYAAPVHWAAWTLAGDL